MRTAISLGLILLMNPIQSWSAEPCRVIHGRAIEYTGDGFLAIWHIGTHHTFYVVDEKSTDLILERMHFSIDDSDKALFADFTVCPTAPFKRGASQQTRVTQLRNAHIVRRP